MALLFIILCTTGLYAKDFTVSRDKSLVFYKETGKPRFLKFDKDEKLSDVTILTSQGKGLMMNLPAKRTMDLSDYSFDDIKISSQHDVTLQADLNPADRGSHLFFTELNHPRIESIHIAEKNNNRTRWLRPVPGRTYSFERKSSYPVKLRVKAAKNINRCLVSIRDDNNKVY